MTVTLARRMWRSLGWMLAAVVCAVLLVQLWYFAHLLWWTQFNPRSTAFMEARLSELRLKQPQANLRQQWVSYERISGNLKRAVVAAEDAKFVDHEGFDWDGIQRALRKNEQRGRVVAGGSTISQQLAKNLFPSGERSWIRKAQEAAITWMLEALMDKRRILELYLNVAEWGNGVFGAEAAARHYYGIGAAQLNPDQAAWLAAILPAPRRADQHRDAPWIERKAAVLLQRMGQSAVP